MICHTYLGPLGRKNIVTVGRWTAYMQEYWTNAPLKHVNRPTGLFRRDYDNRIKNTDHAVSMHDRTYVTARPQSDSVPAFHSIHELC